MEKGMRNGTCTLNGGEGVVDRISELPDDVLHRIISFLSMKWAIRTSTLSRRWRHLWKFTPVINFRLTDDEAAGLGDDFGFIGPCLSLHQASEIRDFVVIGELDDDRHDPPIDHLRPEFQSWIEFAITKKVRSLEICLRKIICFSWSYLELPATFHTRNAESIEKIILSWFAVESPTQFCGGGGYGCLRKLGLYDCKISEEALISTLSSCPVLQSLILVRCPWLRHVKIPKLRRLEELVVFLDGQNRPGNDDMYSLEADAPCLRILKISLCETAIQIQGSPPLFQVSIAETYGTDNCPQNILNLENFFNQLLQTEFLDIHVLVFRYFLFDHHYKPGGGWTSFKNLNKLYISKAFMLFREEVIGLLAFIKDCPVLQTLQMDFHYSLENEGVPEESLGGRVMDLIGKDGVVICYRPGMEMCDCSNKTVYEGPVEQLRNIELFNFTGYGMDIVMLLLRETVNLESLLLIHNVNPEHFIVKRMKGRTLSVKDRVMIRDHIDLLPRVSSRAQILVANSH